MFIAPYIRLLRVHQWLKNLMLLFPPFLGGEIIHPGMLEKGVIPIVSFCLASSATYILNDILDASKDSLHQTKKNRPIPSGAINKHPAMILAFLVAVVSVILALLVSQSFLFLLSIYAGVSVLYSLKLKELPIVDLFCISAGFLLRLQAGGVAFGVEISDWLFLSVLLLSLFLSTGKRLCEKIALGDNAGSHRKSLLSYPEGFLEGVMYMTGGAVLVTYTMYVIAHHFLIYTVPLCAFGLLRYLYRVKSGHGGDPTDSLLRDRPLFAVSLLWAVMVGWGIYGR